MAGSKQDATNNFGEISVVQFARASDQYRDDEDSTSAIEEENKISLKEAKNEYATLLQQDEQQPVNNRVTITT